MTKLLDEISIRYTTSTVDDGQGSVTTQVVPILTIVEIDEGNNFFRRTLNPGDNYAGEVDRVKAICDVVFSETYLGYPVPTDSDWDSFNAYMLSDPMFKGYRNTVRSADGELNSALFDAYGLVATNGVGAFRLVWGIWCTASGITASDREVIAGVAEGYNLPEEFISIIEE